MYTYSSESGWGMLASSLDDAHKNLLDQLKALGFTHTEPEMIRCRTGVAHLYVRYIPPGKKALPLAFDFCCILTISGFLYVVGLKTLQDVFAFLAEIDAHPVVPQPVTLADDERKAVQRYIASTMKQMRQHIGALGNVAAWQRAVERLAQALEEASRHGLLGQSRSAGSFSVPTIPKSRQNTRPSAALSETHDDAGCNGGPPPAIL